MDGRDVAVPKEVGSVQSEQVSDAMNPHYDDEAGIVDLHAGNRMGDDQAAPLHANPFVIRQKRESAFDQPAFTVGLRYTHPEAILFFGQWRPSPKRVPGHRAWPTRGRYCCRADAGPPPFNRGAGKSSRAKS